MKWLFALLLFSAAFATTDFTRVVETEVGYAEVSGVEPQGDLYVVTGDTLTVHAKSTAGFTAVNYSVRLTPRNLERVLGDMEVPLNMGLGYVVPADASFRETFQLPEIVCGTYTARGEAYYAVGGELRRFEDSLKVRVPCRNVQSGIVAGLFARLPYGLLKGLAGFLGFDF